MDWAGLAVGHAAVQKPPAALKANLRNFQMKGLQWMANLHVHGMNGILADDLGLGKTVQVIAMLAHLMFEVPDRHSSASPALVIVPSSLIANWEGELARWAPDLRVLSYKGTASTREILWKQQMKRQPPHVVITSFDFALRDHLTLSAKRWRYLVVDEGHRLKNADCKLSIRLRCLNADGRLLLTGTPVHNSLEDLWALLNFVMPLLFGSSQTFAGWFAGTLKHDTCEGDDEAALLSQEESLLVADRLHLVLRPFMLRRLKEDVATELPRKVEHLIRCAPSLYQTELFRIVQHKLKQEALDQPPRGVNISNSVMELRNICNHPTLSRLHPEGIEALLPAAELPVDVRMCGKMDVLDRMLVRLHGTGHKVLVFCTMTQCLDVIEQHLNWRGFQFERLDGATSSAERGPIVQRFCDPGSDSFVFLLSIRAGGVGLNLQAADTVIMYDTDWNPQIDLQAQSRAHRIGQDHRVLVLRLQTMGSIEEKVASVAAQKRAIADASITGGFFDGGATSADTRRKFLLDLLKTNTVSAQQQQALPTSSQQIESILQEHISGQCGQEQAATAATRDNEMTPTLSVQEAFESRRLTSEEAELIGKAAWEYACPTDAEPVPAEELCRGKRRRNHQSLNKRQLSGHCNSSP